MGKKKRNAVRRINKRKRAKKKGSQRRKQQGQTTRRKKEPDPAVKRRIAESASSVDLGSSLLCVSSARGLHSVQLLRMSHRKGPQYADLNLVSAAEGSVNDEAFCQIEPFSRSSISVPDSVGVVGMTRIRMSSNEKLVGYLTSRTRSYSYSSKCSTTLHCVDPFLDQGLFRIRSPFKFRCHPSPTVRIRCYQTRDVRRRSFCLSAGVSQEPLLWDLDSHTHDEDDQGAVSRICRLDEPLQFFDIRYVHEWNGAVFLASSRQRYYPRYGQRSGLYTTVLPRIDCRWVLSPPSHQECISEHVWSLSPDLAHGILFGTFSADVESNGSLFGWDPRTLSQTFEVSVHNSRGSSTCETMSGKNLLLHGNGRGQVHAFDVRMIVTSRRGICWSNSSVFPSAWKQYVRFERHDENSCVVIFPRSTRPVAVFRLDSGKVFWRGYLEENERPTEAVVLRNELDADFLKELAEERIAFLLEMNDKPMGDVRWAIFVHANFEFWLPISILSV